jgi:hypothetical protein
VRERHEFSGNESRGFGRRFAGALFRLTMHIFIGVSAGYAAVVAWYDVIWPQLVLPFFSGNQSQILFALVPLLLSGLLLLKVSPRLSRLGNPAVAYLVGVGAAAGIGGAVMGTIFPQVGASINLFDTQIASQGAAGLVLRLAEGSVILVGTLTTLIYFHFGVRPRQDNRSGSTSQRSEWIDGLGWVGQVFIAITLGALFAGVYSAALTALIERLYFLGDFLLPLFLTR